MKCVTVLAIAAMTASFGASAACSKDGTRTQAVFLSVEGKQLERWTPAPDEIHRTRLPGGFVVGIQIEPTTPEKYRETLAKTKWQAVDELVKISIYDANGDSPKLLSTTWGGANSKQGFGPRGGANGVPALGDQIELFFHNPVCVTPETLANVK
jgi:hypothetical protein